MFLERFLNGDQPLPEIVLPEESPPLLVQTIWYEDTLRLRDFFERKTRLLRHLRAAFGLDETYVNQDQLDDFHVIEKSRSKPGAIKTS